MTFPWNGLGGLGGYRCGHSGGRLRPAERGAA